MLTVNLMPYQFDFDPTHRILRGRMLGPITDELLKRFYKDMRECLELVNPCAGVADFSLVSQVKVTRETVLQLAESTPPNSDPRRPRVVIAGSPLLFGLARMFEMAVQEKRPNIHVVLTEQEAWTILGLHEAPEFRTSVRPPT
jgi:hypothetical protein